VVAVVGATVGGGGVAGAPATSGDTKMVTTACTTRTNTTNANNASRFLYPIAFELCDKETLQVAQQRNEQKKKKKIGRHRSPNLQRRTGKMEIWEICKSWQ
jgi:3-keto-L-gulonate-6-phosphate decarboxylase